MAEALNGTFKAELIEMQGPWKNFDQVERAIFQWVPWYNEEQLRSAVCEELDEEAGRRTVHVSGVARRAQLQVDRPPVLAHPARRDAAHDEVVPAP